MNPPAAHQLPSLCLITGAFNNAEDFRHRLEQALLDGPKLVQLKAKGLTEPEYLHLAGIARELCTAFGVPLLAATSLDCFARLESDGLHLRSDQLEGLRERPIAKDKLLSISCHTPEDLALANRLGADLLLLSPIKPTASHPDLPGLGWATFSEMTAGLEPPVYALGGVTPDDLGDALNAGAQGIAGTRGLWS